MFGKKNKEETKNVENKDSTKKVTPKKNTSSKVLGINKKINMYEDIFKQLEMRKILTNNDLKVLLSNREKGFKYNNIEEFLDDIIEVFGKEKEHKIINAIFKEHLGYKTELNIEKVEPDLTMLNLFKQDELESLLEENKNEIFKSKILPIQIIQENKIIKLLFVTRSPIIPEKMLSIFKEILDKEKILDGEVIIVDKETYNDVSDKLKDEQYVSVL